MLPPLDLGAPYAHVRSVEAVSVADRLLRGLDGQSMSLAERMVGPAPGVGRLTDLRGLGREVWQDLDADRYVKELRDEWS